MSIFTIENTIDAIKEYLESNLAAKLDELDVEYADFTLDNIAKWYVAELTAVPAYPVGLLLGDRIESLEQNGFIKSYHIITAACLATDIDAERLRRRLYRYIRAIAEVVYGGQETMKANIFLTGADYSPLYSRTGGFLADARVAIRVLRYED